MTRVDVLNFLNRPDVTNVILWCMGLMAASIPTLLFLHLLHLVWVQKLGYKCLICKQHWVGKGCACVPRRSDKIVRPTNPNFLALSLDEKLYHRMRFAQRRQLQTRGITRTIWKVKRDTYLQALSDYRDSRKQGIFR